MGAIITNTTSSLNLYTGTITLPSISTSISTGTRINPWDSTPIVTDYYVYPKIVDINVYGNDEPKVVEVEFKYGYETTKIKSICCDEDEFDLKKGVYIALSKLLYGKEYTTEGVEEKAHELSLKKDNEKMVNKAIKEYYKKIKAKEEAKEKEKQKKKEELARKKKNEERKKKQRERKRKEEANVIAEAIKIANSK